MATAPKPITHNQHPIAPDTGIDGTGWSLRTSDGRERAKKAGVKFGPKPKLTRHQLEEVRRLGN